MEIYRSAGVAIIAALMGPDRRAQKQRGSVSIVDGLCDGVELAHPQDDRAVQGCGEFRQIGRRCERAVVTAYRELRNIGTADRVALRTCATLYRIHHPEASASDASRQVEEWVLHHIIGGHDGSLSGCDCPED